MMPLPSVTDIIRSGVFLHGYDAAEIARLGAIDIRRDEPGIVELRNVICIPGYGILYDEAGIKIDLTSRTYRPPGCYDARFMARYRASVAAKEPDHIDPPSELETVDETVFFAGMFVSHYGHFLTDSLSRLWPADSLREGRRFYYQGLGGEVAEDHSFARTILEAGGLDLSKRIHVSRPTMFRRMIVPCPSMQHDKRVHFEHARFPLSAARILADGGNRETAPVYLSRSGLSQQQRGASNEAELETALERRGVSILHPQRLTVRDQVALFNGRRTIIGCSGSALHTALIALDGRSSTTLVNLTLPFIDHRFLLVDGITQHKSDYLNACSLLPEQSKSRGRFVADVGLVMDFLAQSKVI